MIFVTSHSPSVPTKMMEEVYIHHFPIILRAVVTIYNLFFLSFDRDADSQDDQM